ncbi:MAG TPA: PEP-CTERM sorting domain-containing protein [Myxococcota bacterium]|nr:PEP-CTERM sorting domain-containing protein [Myxococcota bacterium]
MRAHRLGTARRWKAALAAFILLSLGGRAGALVIASDPNDGTPFFGLFRPTGQFDETALSGFEFLISSRTGQFRANDQYLIAGEATEEGTSLAADLGGVTDLSGVAFGFSIQHHLAGGRNLTFRVVDPRTSAASVLCWGLNCAPGSTSAEVLGGLAPIDDYNGLQIQVRAQQVAGASAAVTITSLSGVDLAGAALFDEVVTPDSPGTILPVDAGRRGQWLLADSLDLVRFEWELAGTVTLSRPDEALVDLTQVRLAVDLVRDPTLPYVPEPSTGLLVGCGLAALARRRGGRRSGRRDS